MHGTAQSKVSLDVPLEDAKLRSDASKALLQQLMLANRVEDHEPVAWGCLGVGAIGPELGEYPSVIT